MWESNAAPLVLASVFLISLVLGYTIARTNYCTLGAVSDWVNMSETSRLRAWLTAIGTATLGVTLLTATGLIDLAEARIPHTSAIFAWPRYLLGGFTFGIGMTLASGCTSKNLVRLGAGSGKALIVLVVATAAAYLMIKTQFYDDYINRLLSPAYIDLRTLGYADQRLGTLVARSGFSHANFIVGLGITAVLFGFAFSSPVFRALKAYWVGGIVVGLAVVAAWYLSASPWGVQWAEDAAFLHDIPPGIGVQSLSFVSPLADAVGFARGPDRAWLLTFGLAAAFGVIAGSTAESLAHRRWRWEWFGSGRDLLRNLAGGLLLGFGGVLALGCTIGQGVTGASTLAAGSWLATIATIFGAALSMKIEFYRMVYAGNASIFSALLSSLVDFRLLPKMFRRLDRI